MFAAVSMCRGRVKRVSPCRAPISRDNLKVRGPGTACDCARPHVVPACILSMRFFFTLLRSRFSRAASRHGRRARHARGTMTHGGVGGGCEAACRQFARHQRAGRDARGGGRWPEVALRRKPKRGRGPVCSASARAGQRWRAAARRRGGGGLDAGWQRRLTYRARCGGRDLVHGCSVVDPFRSS